MKKAVFLCTCENTLNNIIAFDTLAKFASKLKDVVHSEVQEALCTKEGLEIIKSCVKDKDIDGIVIGACSPRRFGDFFQSAVEDIKEEEIFTEQAAIREHAAWVHRDNPEMATNIAEILIDMADASVSLSETVTPAKVDLTKKALVIGGGMAGMTSALDLADAGIPVILVERKDRLGGRAIELAKTYPTSSCGICCIESCSDCILTPKEQDILSHPKIITLLESEVKDVKGRFGSYVVTINSYGKEMEQEVGIIFIATGSEVFNPSKIDHYNYLHPDVITSLDFNKLLIEQRGQGKLVKPSDGSLPKSINFVLCVGSRANNPSLGSTHCSLVCCTFAIGQAKTIRRLYPEIEVTIHYTDLRSPFRGFEDQYREAREVGVNFMRGRVAEIREMPNIGLQVLTKDIDLGRSLILNTDLVVLYVGQEASSGTLELSEMLNKSLDSDGFFKELNLRLEGLNRVHTRTHEPGVNIVGCAQGPRGIRQSIADARVAALYAIELFRSEQVNIGSVKAFIDEKRCDGCAYCIEPCPFEAVSLVENENGKLALIDPTLCEGCGICMATCPKDGVRVPNFSLPQLRAKVSRALVYAKPNPKIIAFFCNWCGHPALDLAGVNKATYPPIVPIRVMCTGSIHPNVIMDAFTQGADGIMVFGCEMEECHYIDGNKIMDQRKQSIELIMEDLGLEPERFRIEWITGRHWRTFSRIVQEFHDRIEELGRSIYAQ